MTPKYQDKMMRTESAERLPKSLTCIQEQMVPGFGTFQAGQVITEEAAIAAVFGNPHFIETQEE